MDLDGKDMIFLIEQLYSQRLPFNHLNLPIILQTKKIPRMWGLMLISAIPFSWSALTPLPGSGRDKFQH